jgi:hypothetical protein
LDAAKHGVGSPSVAVRQLYQGCAAVSGVMQRFHQGFVFEHWRGLLSTLQHKEIGVIGVI